MIVSTYIQKIFRFCKDSFAAANLNPHNFSFAYCVKIIVPGVNMGETAYFQNHDRLHYGDIVSVWKKTTIIK